MKEYPVKSYFDFDDSIKTIFVRTFNKYLYPRIIAEHAELFKKNFKILDKYFRNDFISEGIVQTEPSGLSHLYDIDEEELEQNPGAYAVF